MIKNIQRDKQGRVESGTCHCGQKVWLGAFTCECDHCGRLYNWAGQELMPVEHWEEPW